MRPLGRLAPVALLLASLLLAVSAQAVPIVLTFEPSEIGETEPQPVNGLGSVSGVSFGFTVGGSDSDAAEYGASPEALDGDFTDFVSSPVLEGDATGILTLVFDEPASSFSFGLAMDDIFPGKGFDITLFDASASLLGSTPVNISVQPGKLFAEVLYSYTDATAVKTAVIDFNAGTPPLPPTKFWLDNLTFQPIPEPGTAVLLASGLMGLGWMGRRRPRA